MSKMSIRSKVSGTRYRRKYAKKDKTRPYDFCCSLDDFDPLIKYEKRRKAYKSSLMPIEGIQESPVLKFQTQSVDQLDAEQKKKISKNKALIIGDHNQGNLTGSYSLSEPMHWHIEDELEWGKEALWQQKRKLYNQEMDKNTAIGRKRTKRRMAKMGSAKYPPWYQDFSFDQMENLMLLADVIQRDYEEMVTGRTQRTLMAIGVISTFFKLSPPVIRRLQKTCDNPVDFLREIYKILTGNYFEDEGHRKSYDCNERIILSSIAFLTLPETIVELHKRLPPVVYPKLPPKPLPPVCPPRRRRSSPYKEDLFTRPDWATYRNKLQDWQKRCRLIPRPRVILPPKECIITNYRRTEMIDNRTFDNKEQNSIMTERQKVQHVPQTSRAQSEKESIPLKTEEKKGRDRDRDKDRREVKIDKREEEQNIVSTTEQTENEERKEEPIIFDIPRLPNENQVFDFTINGISQKPGPVEYKICGTLKPPQPNKKSWLGEKDAHYLISGAMDNPPTCPVPYEMTGIANVTPTNSNERFFAVLKLADGPKKIYPSGRKNLSKNWQEWLQNADEEFKKVEKEANKMIKSIEATMRLVFPGPTCDSCCSCRQTRKSHIKWRETKAPYLMIDTIAEDDHKNKFIVGSMAMHSPAPSPVESAVNLLEVVASEDRMTTNIVINGVTNEKGETQYFISGVRNDTIRIPSYVIEPPPPRPLRNVPPCACAVHHIFNKGLASPIASKDHIPWTKDEGLCFGKKYRPDEPGAYSCKMYPGDKSCRRNPFLGDIAKLKRRMQREKAKKQQKDVNFKDRKMYSIADFPPCGDEHGMGVCGGPWGAKTIWTPEELAEKERIRKEILRAPPCGKKPGKSVCEGPWGARVPRETRSAKVLLLEDELGEHGTNLEEAEEEETEEEEEEEEEEKEEPVVEEVKVKERKRDKKCFMSPESIAGRKKVIPKKVGKFIPDPNYHGYDDLWNIFRTAPSVKEIGTEYEQSLKLSSPERSPPRTIAPIPSEVKKQDEAQSTSKQIEKTMSKRPEKAETKRDARSEESRRRSPAKISQERGKPKKTSVPSPLRSSAPARTEQKSLKVPSMEKKLERIPSGQAPRKILSIPKEIAKPSSKLMKKRIDDKERTLSAERQPKQTQKKTKKKTRISKKMKKPIKLLPQVNKFSSKNGDVKQKTKRTKRQVEHVQSTGKPAKSLKARLLHDPKDRQELKSTKRVKDKKSKGKKMKKSSLSKNLLFKFDRKKLGKAFEHKKQKSAKQSAQDAEPMTQKKKIENLKTMMTSPERFSHNVEPVVLPEEPRAPCAREPEDSEESEPSVHEVEPPEVGVLKKGPCGWRTKSEQELPTKKNLIYLTEPDYPMEMIPVRPGGKPCICRENRDKKKILLYSIGGLTGKKKTDTDDVTKLFKKKTNDEEERKLIEGVIYYTPPPSPRRSDEYIPEYDLYESPYDMCLTKRKDRNLKLLAQHVGPKSLMSKVMDMESCGCNHYIDSYGLVDPDQVNEKEKAIQELDKTRQELIEAKSPKERWTLALKDVGLIDYFTRCRDQLPCWLTCTQFNRLGCCLRYRNLKMKRPVCECKYERKILENKEEKIHWKQRQQKLKSLKKQPIMNVVDTSRPIEPDTKLMISGVKRIPQDDEYIDDIKYCITGVAENYSMAPPQQVVGGLHMSTPFQTPEPSKTEIPCACLHRHWSPLNIPPGPLPKKDEALIEERKRRQEVLEEAYRQIYAPVEIYDGDHKHSCQETCGTDKDKQATEEMQEDNRINFNNKARSSKVGDTNVKRHNGKKVDKWERGGNPKTTSKEVRERSKSPEKKLRIDAPVLVNEPNQTKLEATKKNVQKEKRDEYNIKKDDNTKKIKVQTEENVPTEDESPEEDSETDLKTLMKMELKKMAEEHFLFAKLPKCAAMPELEHWLVLRQGVVYTDADRRDYLRNSIATWNIMDAIRPKKIEVPSLGMTKRQLANLTFDDVERVKRKIAQNKAIFYSNIRKARVAYARSMWRSMEPQKFPCRSFKRAYFTYMASKEADGLVFKPWSPSETRGFN